MGTKRGQSPGGVDAIATAITVKEELREATREARETLKDMTAALRELAAERKRIEDLHAKLPQLTEETIGDQLREEVAKLEKVTLKAMDDAVERVNSKFDELSDILMGKTKAQQRRSGLNLEEIISRMVGLPPGIPVEITVENLDGAPHDPDR